MFPTSCSGLGAWVVLVGESDAILGRSGLEDSLALFRERHADRGAIQVTGLAHLPDCEVILDHGLLEIAVLLPGGSRGAIGVELGPADAGDQVSHLQVDLAGLELITTALHLVCLVRNVDLLRYPIVHISILEAVLPSEAELADERGRCHRSGSVHGCLCQEKLED